MDRSTETLRGTRQASLDVSTPTITAQIGPRIPGTVYDNASGVFRVLSVVTDPSEARRVLRRNAARFAVLIEDLHTRDRHYTGATWTGSDRVLKAVAA
ncbi:hypothetical protein [Streptomyces longwoodensis]|uniref:hypothetical protein n=1 Tax=Streptomyces longwoodensis TaxID=68231 RepID=UPI0022510E6A|nr:hypothetical protein [Streptomyces longwoodensis]MCX5001015.1 hypothetical protein [Streptomyces longwoodensis]